MVLTMLIDIDNITLLLNHILSFKGLVVLNSSYCVTLIKHALKVEFVNM
jgi:hypothetical protein